MHARVAQIGLAIGIVMIGLSLYIGLRPVLGRSPLSGTVALDVAFAVFFLIRGVVQVRRWRSSRGRQP
jgi:uncharacterized membrane protein HdeD (DUF308 family)